MRLLGLVASLLPTLPTAVLAAATSPGRRDVVRDVPLLLNIPGQVVLPTIEEILTANLTNGSYVTTDNIQSDILVGMKKNIELFWFFHVNDATGFKSALRNTIHPLVTSTTTILGPVSQQPLAMVNIAFSHSGLTSLGILDDLGDIVFPFGMTADASVLGDPGTVNWHPPFVGTGIHGVIIIASDQQQFINDTLDEITEGLGTSATEVTRVNGAARQGENLGHEHFGFLDGIGQPGISGFNPTFAPGVELSLPGTILLGRLGDIGVRPAWAKDGSFLVFRLLQQFVPEFDKYLVDNAIQAPDGSLTPEEGAELLGARMIGRWKSGAPVDLFPRKDNATAGTDPNVNNNFDYDHPLPFLLPANQSYCPWTAHTRKNRPRADELDVNGIMVIMRSSIPYGPDVTAAELAANKTSIDRGLAFVAYNSDIGLGFRFQQTMWDNSQIFPPLKTDITPGFEPIISLNNGNTRSTAGLDPFDPGREYVLEDFTLARGGEYFFSPPIPALLDPIGKA